MKYALLPRAEADLEDIWLYIAADNRAAADKMAEKFELLFEKLTQFPLMGRERPDIRPRLRSFAISPYVAFYRVHRDLIEVVRVLHGSRDIARVFDA